MISPPSSRLLLFCIAIAVGVLCIPIDEQTVVEHSTNKLGRSVITELLAGYEEKDVVLRFSGVPAAETALRNLITRREYATLVDEGVPILDISLTQEGAVFKMTGAFGDNTQTSSVRKANWMSLLAPLLAVLLALLIRNVVIGLFGGVWVGSTVLAGGNPLAGLWSVAIDYVYPVLTDSFNLQILGFTFSLVGMVAVIGRMGGTKGLVNAASRFAKGPRSAQAVTASMGTIVFFDDYANTLVVGTTARALTDRLRVSREKLAYIVDSTSAPVAGIAIISTWIGYEVGLFDSLLVEFAHVAGVPTSGYGLFFEILPLRFYCIFALALVFLVAFSGRDLGPMYRAEKRVRMGGPVVAPNPSGSSSLIEAGELSLEKPGVEPRLFNAVVPISLVLGFIAFRVWQIGHVAVEDSMSVVSMEYWRLIFTKAGDDMGSILFMAGIFGSVVAFALSLAQGILTPKEAVTAYTKGMGSLLEASAILILAWVIKSVCDDSSTGFALVGMVGKALPAVGVPLVVFVLSGVVAFSTGSSWGTMALILPVAAPLATALSGELPIILAAMGAVLDGAIWGDHCSPISDTTVLSSTATGCPHMDHVKTQAPYAMLAMLAAAFLGYLGYALGANIFMIYGAGLVAMTSTLMLVGRKA